MDLDNTFNCSGKVNSNDWQLNKASLFLQGEIRNVLFSEKEYPFSHSDIELFNYVLPAATPILNLKHFVKCTEMKLKQLSRYEKYTQLPASTSDEKIDYYMLRKTVCQFIVYVRSYLNSIKDNEELLRTVNEEIGNDLGDLALTIKRFLGRLQEIPVSTFYYAPSNLGNKCLQPEFHMYHMHLELRWLYITLIYIQTIPWYHDSDSLSEDLDNTMEIVVNDLVYISAKLFQRISLNELRLKSPYCCTCMRELWLMLQILSDNLAEKMRSKTFWEYVNCALQRILNKSGANVGQRFWHRSTKSRPSDCKNPELFCVWLIYHTALLYGYSNDGTYLEFYSTRIKPNHEEVVEALKVYVNRGGKVGERDEMDEELRAMIPLLRVLVNDWWQPRVEIISSLWDCFHRRLDQAFLLHTQRPWSMSLEKKKPTDILNHIKDRIDANLDQSKESSYGMFLHLLGIFLKRTYKPDDLKYWNQIKGRVYTKFSKSKVQEFSEVGLYNFISLFLTLAVTADTAGVCTVMFDLLPDQYNKDDIKRGSIIWKGKLAFLILYSEHRLNFNKLSAKLMDTVNIVSCCKGELARNMITNFVDVLGVILKASNRMELSEYSFIGGWIDRYLLECPKNRTGILFEILITTFEKCKQLNSTGISDSASANGVKLMLNALWEYVACRVRQLVLDPVLTGENYRDISKLAVLFTLEALRDPATAKHHRHTATSLFQHFTTSVIVKDIRITKSYLASILQEKSAISDLRKELKNFHVIVIQTWVKCSILDGNSGDDQMKCILKYVASLDHMKDIFWTNADLLEFENSGESIIHFMMAIMKKRNCLQRDRERISFDANCRTYFANLEKWVLLPINGESTESDLALWICRCVGTLILCCAPVLYAKQQPNNLLKSLIKEIALPSEQSGHLYVEKMGKKIFSLIILGIENLNVKGDLVLEKLIEDLFERYLPLLITGTTSKGTCKISDSLLKCFRDAKHDFLRSIVDKLAVKFITIIGGNTTHKHCYLVMLLLRNLLKGTKTYASHLTELIISRCVPHVINCYMKVPDLHPHKQQTIDFMGDVVTNFYYKQEFQMREKFKNILRDSIQEYLTSTSQGFFKFVGSMTTVDVEVVRSMLPKIESKVTELENSRSPNAASLRYSLENLKSILRDVRPKS